MTKCATDGCLKKVWEEGDICDRCARSASTSREEFRESPMRSIPEASSISKEPGVVSLPQSGDVLLASIGSAKSTPTIPPTEQKRTTPESAPSKSTLASDGPTSILHHEAPLVLDDLRISERIRNGMKNSGPGIITTESEGSQPSAPTATEFSPPVLSTGQLLTPEEEKLASMSLCDDVISRLHLQMKRLTHKADEPAPVDPIGHSHSERQNVALALKTAGEIGKMIRLKLDAVKVFRKLED